MNRLPRVARAGAPWGHKRSPEGTPESSWARRLALALLRMSQSVATERESRRELCWREFRTSRAAGHTARLRFAV